MTHQWIRRGIYGAAALAVYALAGFVGVPWLLTSQLPPMAERQLGRTASVQAVQFNPFTLRLQARDVRLQEAGGQPLLSLDELRLRLQWRSLLRGAWSLEELHLGQPRVHLIVDPDGQLNLARLAASLPRGEPDPNAKPPRLEVAHFSVSGGRVDVDDRQVGYRSVLAPITFDVQRLSTLLDARNRHLVTAESSSGARLRWEGEASLQPLQAQGTVTLENVDLAAYNAYLKPHTPLRVAGGRLALTGPYRLAYAQGQMQARIEGGQLDVQGLALGRDGERAAFAAVESLRVEGLDADLVRRSLALSALRVQGGHLHTRRNARGALDLAQLAAPTPASAPSAAPAAAPAGAPQPAAAWTLAIATVELGRLALRATDETVQPPVTLEVGQAGLQLQLQAGAPTQADTSPQVQVTQAALDMKDLTVSQGARKPLQLARLALERGQVDLAARRIEIGRVSAQGGRLQLVRDANGLDLMALVPRSTAAPAPAAASGKSWSARIQQVEGSRWTVDAQDQPSGIALRLQEVGWVLDRVSTEAKEPIAFRGGLRLDSGGRVALRGRALAASGRIDAEVDIDGVALAPLQPLLAQHVRLQLVGGTVSAQGQLQVGPATAQAAAPLRYEGNLAVSDLALQDDAGKPFLSWKQVAAPALSLRLSPARLEIPELRIVEPRAILILESDRSFNAARLLVRPAAGSAADPAAKTASPPAQSPPTAAAPAAATDEPFAVRIPRVRLQGAQVFFEDRSLRPQFGAEIHALQGVITGVSSQRDGRSLFELDGQVGEFGLARVRGGLNPFVPRDNTDLTVNFRNLDLIPTTPYAMKFAGYRIAEGKMSLDLRYKVREGKLDSQNRIVLDRLTLGERVESPDALKLPLALALAILRDSDGRIDLDLPITGDLDNPQFSYGAIVWKAIGNVLTKIVTAPFRALGALLGLAGEKLEAIAFDPGSARLLPPEREKLQQLAEILGKRAQLRVVVAGAWHEAADGAALRALAVRSEVARRAGIRLEPGETPGPLDLADGKVRSALRAMFTSRFGDAALAQARAQAEAAPDAVKSPAWQQAMQALQGEPRLADARGFYRTLRQRLEQAEPLPRDALEQLAAQRAQAVTAALAAIGVDAGRVSTAPAAASPEAVEGAVPLKLELAVSR